MATLLIGSAIVTPMNIVKQQKHSGFLQLVTIILAMLYKPLPVNCEDCTTVHRYINASADNYVTFKPCYDESSDSSSCSFGYAIRAVEILSPDTNTPSDHREAVKTYWSDVEVFLVVR